MTTNGRKRYFHIDEDAAEQIYALLDDVESADEDDIDNLINDSDTEFKVEEEITQAVTAFFYKQSIFEPRPENCLSFSKKSPQKTV